MPKWILYVVIVLLLGALGYVLWGDPNREPTTGESESNIEVSPATITESEPSVDPVELPADQPLIAITGTLVGFIDDARDGPTALALINDGTEVITINMESLVDLSSRDPGALEQLDLAVGDTVTVRGFVNAENTFIAREYERQ